MTLTIKQKIEAIKNGTKIRFKGWSEREYIYWDNEEEKWIDRIERKRGFTSWLRNLFDEDHIDFDKWEYFEEVWDKCGSKLR